MDEGQPLTFAGRRKYSFAMEIRIYDVEHGDAIFILSKQNEAVLIDCGYNNTTKWRPSSGLARQGFGTRRKLHHLIITHPDQDHLADLPDVLEKLRPVNVWQHPQLTVRSVSELKASFSKAQIAYVERNKTTADLQPAVAAASFRTMKLRQFYLPIGSVREINDLSLLSFITEDGFTVCLPGDLDARGWRLHLQNKAVQYLLRETNLFIASHHGRPSGYCKEVFEFLHPKLIAISDKEQIKGRAVVQRAPYAEHAVGVKLADGRFRRVLPTKTEGRIRIVVQDGQWQVETSRSSSPNPPQSRYTSSS
jgi:beta-lactamase superfamily II metal-dependent hydrolase